MVPHIRHLLKKSKEVFLDCALENGGIVAANTDNLCYSKETKNYRFVWPRDAAFILYAVKLLGIPKIEERFVRWLLERVEGFLETGLLFRRYATNGAKDPESGAQYQPDQAGALLWALTRGRQKPSKEKKQVISLLAEGLCGTWQGKHFSRTIYDLWEERKIIPREKSNFVYSLAACSVGLSQAARKVSQGRWEKASQEMGEAIQRCNGSYYPRICGTRIDRKIDASCLGLVWPFRVEALEQRMVGSLKMIEQKLFSSRGILRYEGDRYDGAVKEGKTGQGGGGSWPLLTFWYVIALSRIDRKKEADLLFRTYSQQFMDNIPEQVFSTKGKSSITPLAWSHAMFVIAAYELGYKL
ncbi:MAG: glycoside hydrolase family 15 protein [Patescibacteria group bacterium]